MTKKGFKASFSELYLINPTIYNKMIDNISDQIEKEEMLNLNKKDEALENMNETPQSILSEAENNTPAENTDQSSENQSENDLILRLQELKDLIIKNSKTDVNHQVQSTKDFGTQYLQKDLEQNLHTDAKIPKFLRMTILLSMIVTSRILACRLIH